MRAIHQRRYGGTEQLTVTELPNPTPGPNDVVVRVRAAAVDRGTWHLMAGHPFAVRLAFGLHRPRHPVPGRDVAGVVAEVGSQVTDAAVGDEVIGTADGSFAELPWCRRPGLPASRPRSPSRRPPRCRSPGSPPSRRSATPVGSAPETGSWSSAPPAASGPTPSRSPRRTAPRSPAWPAAARPTWSGPSAATRVIDYTRDDLDDGTRYDVVLDLAGLRPIRQLRRILTDTGTLVIVGGEGGDRWLGGTHRQLAALAFSPFVRQRLAALLSKENGGDLDALAQLVDEGRVRPALERTYELHEAAEAIDHVASGHARGKVAITT